MELWQLKKFKIMNISVELTLLPLNDDFESSIKSFIKKLRTLGFKVLENPMSTHIYGEYTSLMYFLTKSIQESFEDIDAGIISLKIFKSDRSKYIPFD